MKDVNPVRLWALTGIRAARVRAKKYNVPINITVDDMIDLAVPLCPVLGIPLDYGGDIKSDNSPTLDRFVPALGYVRGNISVMSDKANRIKNNGDVDHLRALVRWLTSMLDDSVADLCIMET